MRVVEYKPWASVCVRVSVPEEVRVNEGVSVWDSVRLRVCVYEGTCDSGV